MNQMREKSSIREPTTAPMTEPTMTPARGNWGDDDYDSPLIADEDMMEDEGDEGNSEIVVGVFVGEVVRVEDGDDEEVEGKADAEVGVAIAEKIKTDQMTTPL
jgi:hypothetical protein